MRKIISGMIIVLLEISVFSSVFCTHLISGVGGTICATTTVGGWITSNTTWTQANSPYIVTSNVQVSQNVTLTVEQGVVVKFELGRAMQIEGQLIAQGNETKPIVFTSIKDDTYGGDSNGDGNLTNPTPGDWAYIFFTDPSADATFDVVGNYISGSIMEYCVIKCSGGSVLQGAIHIDSSAPFLNHITVSDNAKDGICVSKSTPKIANSNISHNNRRGINALQSEVTITGNTVTNNLWEGIYVDGGSIISNNTIANNRGNGVVVWGSASIMGNLISYNSARGPYSGEGGGLFVTNGIITNNIIAYNTAPYGGALWTLGTVTVSDNSIIANTATVDSIVGVYGNIDFKYNLLTQNRDNSPASNSIKAYGLPVVNCNNFFNNFHSYEVTDANAPGVSHLDARNNWWGTSNDTEIHAKIYDWIDDASKGIVDYAPYSEAIRTDTPISPPTGLTVRCVSGNFTLSWNPNPEPDLTGYKIYYDTDSDYPYTYSVDVGNATNHTLTGLPSDIKYFTVTAYDNEADGSNDLFEGHESWYAQAQMIPRTSTLALSGVTAWYWTSTTCINSVACGDTDGDGQAEIVTGGYYFDGTRQVAQLVVWNASSLAVEKIKTWYWTRNTVINSVALGDVDGDGQVEIVTGGYFYDDIRNNAQLVVWAGADLSVDRLTAWYWSGDTSINSVSIGDVDADGQTEIVTGGTFNDGTRDVAQLVVWTGHNLAVDRLTSWYLTGNTVINSTAIGDVDGDGGAEIVTGGFFDDGTRWVAQLVVWAGSTLAVDRSTAWYWTYSTVINSVALGDVDGDTQLEIVTGGSFNDGIRDNAQLVVWEGSNLAVDRLTAWYWTSDTVINSVAAGDIDYDGQTEIVTAGKFNDNTRNNAQLVIWSGLSLSVEDLKSWYWTSDTAINSAAISDVNNDSSNEIITGGAFFDGDRSNSQLTVWTIT